MAMNENLITKVLEGSATALEKQQVADWLAAHPGNQTMYDDLKLLWQLQQEEGTLPPGDEGFAKIKARIDKRYRVKKFTSVAATVVLLTTAVILLDQLRHQRTLAPVLHFRHATLTEVVTTLEQQYHVSIEAGSVFHNLTFSGLYINTIPDTILRDLAATLNLHHTKTGVNSHRLEPHPKPQE
jgi:ferric-dicitrate binding protein FerR (iron transport regulator)